jgi:AraC-like DNA-binding protein
MKPSAKRKQIPGPKILVAGITIDPPGATYGPRLQNHFEFIWLMEGEATATFDKQVIRAEAGTLLFRRAGVRDYYEWSPKRRTVHAYVQFDLDAAGRKTLKSSVPTFRVLPPNDVIRPLFGYLLNLEQMKEPLRSRLMVPALELMLLSYITGEWAVKPQPAAHLPEAVERAVEAIRLNTAQEPPESLRLRDLAQAARTTPENLCRLFKKSLELGPLEYAKLARLDRAANRLRRTSLGLKEIAAATGFYDSFHLSRTFKQVYGLSPKEFRESSYNEWISQKNPIIRTLYIGTPVDFLKEPPTNKGRY